MGLLSQLRAREREGRPIRTAVVGAGQMGRGLARQIGRIPGFHLTAVCDVAVDRAVAAAAEAGVRAEVVASAEETRQLLAAGRPVITAQAAWVVVPSVDAVVETTGEPEVSVRLALACISQRLPFVTMTVEADATVGPLLTWMARTAGSVYTLASGDEPSVLCELVGFARAIGFEVVCAGKGKNNRLDRTATARSVADEAVARGMNPRMLAAFVDGTKTMIEMTALANATGLAPDCPGMHGPEANRAELLRTFVPEADGGILRRRGVVDYAIGDVAPGVFLVVAASGEPTRRDLAYLKMGEGPYYLLDRPYHLASLEAPVSVARAVLSGEVTMAAAGRPQAECVAVAKRDLRAGERIDGIGGETVYGLIETEEQATRSKAVPIGIVQGAHLRRDVPRGTALAYDDLDPDEALTIVHLRRLQDALVRHGPLTGVPEERV